MKKSKLFLIASTVALLSQGNVLAADGIYELRLSMYDLFL